MSAFGFSTEPSAGGDFLPIVKYDSRAGRLFRVDRVQTAAGWEKNPVDITSTFKAVFDFDNLETGWINFPQAGAPQFALVPAGTPIPAKPSNDHKNGIRFLVKLDAASAGPAPAVREISSNAKAFLTGTEVLFNDWKAQRDANPGKLPVVVLETTVSVTSGQGVQKSTNYQPKWKITGWAPRPQDLVPQPRGVSIPAPASAPPATGSTVAAPPPAQQPVMAGADDFG